MCSARLLSLLAVVIAASIPSNAAETLRVRADPWMPFNGGDGELPGYVTEILQAIFVPKGIAVEYAAMGWDKALEGCRSGNVDAVPCANAKEARGLVLPQEMIAEIQYAIFVAKDSKWKLAGTESFDGQRIGAAAGYSYWDVLDRYIGSHPNAVVTLNPDEPCLDGARKLMAREVDLLPECPQVFFWNLKQHRIDPARFRMACRMSGDPVFVAFRPDEKGREWAKVFDAGIRTLRANGQLATILAKYQVQDWK